jgi:RNA polymerase primary sigma factor
MSNEELVTLIQQGINAANNLQLLYDQNKGLIHNMAKGLQAYVEIEDLMQEGFIGLYEAVKRYESDREVKFMSYAPHWIRSAMMCCVERQSSTVTAPRHLRGLLNKYRKVINTFTSQVGIEPTDEELCRYLYISQIQLDNLKQYLFSMSQLESLDGALTDEGDTSLGGTIASGQNMEEEILDRMMCQERGCIWDIVKDHTSDYENKVMCMRYKDNLTMQTIGDYLGVTKQAIRQQESNALQKLRRSHVKRILRDKFEIVESIAFKGSVSSFKYTWTSSTEKAAMKSYELSQH